MREYSKSEQVCHACLAAHQVQTTGSIITQLQAISQSERQKNRRPIKSLICCTHFLARNHIAHTTKLVDLVVACGGESLKNCWEEGTVYIKSSCCGVFSMLLGPG